MPSENKTQYLKLNQWSENDRPMRNDFNRDNSIMDSALGGHIADLSIHITEEEREFLREIMTPFAYVGTGESSQTLIFTEPFSAVIVYAKDKVLSQYDSTSGKNRTYWAVGHKVLGSSAGVTISASDPSLTVSQKEDANGNVLCLNEKDVQYRVIILR